MTGLDEDVMAALIWLMDCWLLVIWSTDMGAMRFLTTQELEEIPGEKIVEPWT